MDETTEILLKPLGISADITRNSPQNHWSGWVHPSIQPTETILPQLNTLSPGESVSTRLSPLKFQILPFFDPLVGHVHPNGCRITALF